ncbi:hypothetical protein MUK42_01024 [Musa troglodytarum]|uniref:Uncharacterized protein n=1 Tax=Musa troglodytarum TaxID=320322 RepID=A0A9E7K7M8_9LILI|nr:hypothetical protein MUK42_01024 [Musa troglodytarum]
MLILELGIWIVPLTLVLAPCRRLVLLVARITQIHQCVARSRSRPPAFWSRLARLHSATSTL